jgi:hypothetical protein
LRGWEIDDQDRPPSMAVCRQNYPLISGKLPSWQAVCESATQHPLRPSSRSYGRPNQAPTSLRKPPSARTFPMSSARKVAEWRNRADRDRKLKGVMKKQLFATAIIAATLVGCSKSGSGSPGESESGSATYTPPAPLPADSSSTSSSSTNSSSVSGTLDSADSPSPSAPSGADQSQQRQQSNQSGQGSAASSQQGADTNRTDSTQQPDQSQQSQPQP